MKYAIRNFTKLYPGFWPVSGCLFFILLSLLVPSCGPGRSVLYIHPEGKESWNIEIVAVHTWEGDCNAGYDLFINSYGITEVAWPADSLRESGIVIRTGEFEGIPVMLKVVRRFSDSGSSESRCHDLVEVYREREEIARFDF